MQPKPNTHCTVRRSPGILIVPSINLALSQFTQKIDHVFHTVSLLTENGYIRLSDKTAGVAYSNLYYDCIHHQSYLPLPPSKRLSLNESEYRTVRPTRSCTNATQRVLHTAARIRRRRNHQEPDAPFLRQQTGKI